MQTMWQAVRPNEFHVEIDLSKEKKNLTLDGIYFQFVHKMIAKVLKLDQNYL